MLRKQGSRLGFRIRQGFRSKVRGPGGRVTPVALLAAAGVLGIAGFALAAEPDTNSTVTDTQTTTTATEPDTRAAVSEDTTTTTSEPDTTVTTTVPCVQTASGGVSPNAVVTIIDCTNEGTASTVESTTSTSADGTAAVAGATAGGGAQNGQGGTKGDKSRDRQDPGTGPATANAQAAAGELPFTGLRAPLLILIGVGMAVAGLVLRRRLGDAE